MTQLSQPDHSTTSLVLDCLTKEGIDWIPFSALKVMTEKVAKILEHPGQVIPFPNLQGSILIPSKSDLRNPHIVVLYGKGKIVCNCVNNKSLFICLHSIVYTEHQNIQPKFYTLLKKLRRDQGSYSITLSNLVSAGMPLGRGQKGERPPRATKPTVSYTTTQATSSTATCKHQFRRKDRAATFAEIPILSSPKSCGRHHRNRRRWTNL